VLGIPPVTKSDLVFSGNLVAALPSGISRKRL